MIIIGFGADDFINKLKKVIDEIGKEVSEIGSTLSAIAVQSRKELVRYKILGYKIKPPEGQLLKDKPRVVLHSSFLVLSKDLEEDTARTFGSLRETLEELIFFTESKRNDFRNHLFILVTKGADVLSLYIVSPDTPNFNTVLEELKKGIEEGR